MARAPFSIGDRVVKLADWRAGEPATVDGIHRFDIPDGRVIYVISYAFDDGVGSAWSTNHETGAIKRTRAFGPPPDQIMAHIREVKAKSS